MAVVSLKGRSGRPRRIKLEDIIGAAMEIGLDKFDMASVAKKVGVGVATLYGYVEDRDHLVKLVGVTIAGKNLLQDRGQAWEDALRDYAEMSFAAFRSCPELIQLHLKGVIGDPTNGPVANTLFELLLDRGIEPMDAALLGMQATQAALGAGVTAATFDRLAAEAGEDMKLERKLRAGCEEHDYQALRQCLNAIGFKQVSQDYRPLVESVIEAQRAKMKRARGADR